MDLLLYIRMLDSLALSDGREPHYLRAIGRHRATQQPCYTTGDPHAGVSP